MNFHLNAARGWLELGNRDEANRELDQIQGVLRVHPDVLEVRWQIYALSGMWIAASEIASAICELAPERSTGWMQRAYSLDKLEQTQKAWEVLRSAAESFPQVAAIPYQLACYCCRLNRLQEAQVWLQQAMERGDKNGIARLALADSDLQLLWPQIKRMVSQRSPSRKNLITQKNKRSVRRSAHNSEIFWQAGQSKRVR